MIPVENISVYAKLAALVAVPTFLGLVALFARAKIHAGNVAKAELLEAHEDCANDKTKTEITSLAGKVADDEKARLENEARLRDVLSHRMPPGAR